ncbi:hypothetical protein AB0O76_17235 [Streptomyces sp. NPDC086554]|uniref:hypothetical protein n=1 Tax=Streptomyces sp. NPDC086554 TaxID=3154864 RepID=UPI003437F9AC
MSRGQRLTWSASGGVRDTQWAGECRSAAGVAVLVLAALLAVDALADSFTLPRAVCWAGLALLAFVILLPARVSARPGLLRVRGVLVVRSVRTDSLLSVGWSPLAVSQRLLLRDAQGASVEIDPEVLVRNPALWQRVHADIRASFERDTQVGGEDAFRRLAERIDGETALLVFKASGLG